MRFQFPFHYFVLIVLLILVCPSPLLISCSLLMLLTSFQDPKFPSLGDPGPRVCFCLWPTLGSPFVSSGFHSYGRSLRGVACCANVVIAYPDLLAAAACESSNGYIARSSGLARPVAS